MITLAAGVTIDRTPLPWWVGKEAQCPACKGRVRLEAEDAGKGVTAGAERHPGGKRWVTIECPTAGCGNAFTLEAVKPPFGEAAEFARREETPLA